MSAHDDYSMEMKRKNFTRAAMLAEEKSLGEDFVLAAQRAAIKQAVGDWFNFKGAEALVAQWNFSRQGVVDLCDELITEFEEKEAREGRAVQVFDIDQMDHTPVISLVRQFRGHYK